MKTNELLGQEFINVVRSQMKGNEPPETNLTYKRLISEGYTEEPALQLIAQCVACEIYAVMKFQKPYDQIRFIRNLNRLPASPGEPA